MHGKFAYPILFITFTSFLLLILVTLSLPIIKDIYLLYILGPAPQGSVRVGVFGACYNDAKIPIWGVSQSGFDLCTGVTVGYTLDNNYFGSANANGPDIVSAEITHALILNPVAATFSGFSFLLTLLALLTTSRVAGIVSLPDPYSADFQLTFLTLFITTGLAWASFALDLSVATVARQRIAMLATTEFEARLGGGIWIALGAAILLTLSLVVSGFSIFSRKYTKVQSGDDREGDRLFVNKSSVKGSSISS